MRILVTGGLGFIGSTIADLYVQQGHQVTVLDIRIPQEGRPLSKDARFKQLDVRDKNGLERLFRQGRFEVINHHAAQIDVRKSVADPKYDAEVNILGVINLLQCAVKYKSKKILFSSSGGTVYGECARPARERDPEVPNSPYGVSKLSSEKYIRAYFSLYGLPYTIFRYSNVYGPRQDPHGEAGVVAIFSQKILQNETPFIFGSGRQTRDFVFVEDVARANVLALKKAKNEIVNIGTAKEVSVCELLQKMCFLEHVKFNPVFRAARKGELSRSVLNFGHAKSVLGWTPGTTLNQGLQKTLNYFRQGNRG